MRRRIADNTKIALNNLIVQNSVRFPHTLQRASLPVFDDALNSIADSTISLPLSNTQIPNLMYGNNLVHFTFPLNLKTSSRNNNSTPECQTENDQNELNASEFITKFRMWAFSNPSVTHRCLNELVDLIKPKYPFLPKDARTILETPRNVEIIKLENGEMVYFGVILNLKARLTTEKLENNFVISLQVNIDGIPLYNSSAIEFWPILIKPCTFQNNTPFVAAIFCGEGKPKPLAQYLNPFIEEFQNLLKNGIQVNNYHFVVQLEAFCCDSPARSYLKQTMGHNSIHGCERCVTQSVYSSADKKRFYPINSENEIKRRGADFYEDLSENGHIKDKSPLLKLNIDLVTKFVLDPMHLIYLGVVKRLIVNYWLEGKRPFKISKLAKSKINNLLQTKFIRQHIPSEFKRKIRTLKDIKRWKATEFRFFLLYCGVIVLFNNINTRMYKHFLLLHTAVFILNNAKLIDKYMDIAHNNLISFVNESAEIYDIFFVVYNVHSLVHICEDVQCYGPLENYSCFMYESYLGRLKRTVRGKNLPLQQVNNRIVEMSKLYNWTPSKSETEKQTIPRGVKSKGNGDFFFCTKLSTPKFTISIKAPDNVVAVGCDIYLIKSIYFSNGTYKCTGTRYRYLYDFYTSPIQSSKLGIYYAKGICAPDVFLLTEITLKYMSFPHRNGFVVIPIIHQI